MPAGKNERRRFSVHPLHLRLDRQTQGRGPQHRRLPALDARSRTNTFSTIHDDDIYFCTADIGWVTGHSYVVYGPLCNGATTLMFEGVPTFPDAGRFWKMVEKFKVNFFYTAPTAIRALIRPAMNGRPNTI